MKKTMDIYEETFTEAEIKKLLKKLYTNFVRIVYNQCLLIIVIRYTNNTNYIHNHSLY